MASWRDDRRKSDSAADWLVVSSRARKREHGSLAVAYVVIVTVAVLLLWYVS